MPWAGPPRGKILSVTYRADQIRLLEHTLKVALESYRDADRQIAAKLAAVDAEVRRLEEIKKAARLTYDSATRQLGVENELEAERGE
jgi:hypothetical protein